MNKTKYILMILFAMIFVSVLYWNFQELYLIKFYNQKIFLQKKYLFKLKNKYKEFLKIKEMLKIQKKILDKFIKDGYSPLNYKLYNFNIDKNLKWEELKTIINFLNLSSESVLYKPENISIDIQNNFKKNKKGLSLFRVNIKGKFITRIQ